MGGEEIAQLVVGVIVIGLAVYAVVTYPGLLFRSVKQMRGWWRVAALLPLLVVVPVVIVTIQGLQQGSNLWPILLIFAAPVLFLYQAALLFVHTRIHRR